MIDPGAIESAGILLQNLKGAQLAAEAAEKSYNAAMMRDGQSCVSIGFAGRTIPLTVAARESSYMPVPVAGRQKLLECIQREAYEHLLTCRGKVEGIEHRLRKLLATKESSNSTQDTKEPT